jgi:hypothetical protein
MAHFPVGFAAGYSVHSDSVFAFGIFDPERVAKN